MIKKGYVYSNASSLYKIKIYQVDNEYAYYRYVSDPRFNKAPFGGSYSLSLKAAGKLKICNNLTQVYYGI